MPGQHRDRTAARLVAAALALIAITVVAGAMAGLEVAESTALDLHGPAGTLGWLTLAVLATAAALLPGDDRPWALGWAPIGAAVAYAAAGWLGGDALQAGSATLALAAIIGVVAALAPRAQAARPLSVAQAGALLAVGILAATVALDVVATAGWGWERAAGARSPSLIAAAVLTAAALAEWHLAPSRPVAADTWGLTQVSLFGLGWVALVAGTAADDLILLVGSVGLQVAAVVVFLARNGTRLAGVDWRAVGPRRWLGASVLYLAAHVGLLAHIAFGITGRVYLELARVPVWLRFAAEHVVYTGAAAAALLGLAAALGGRPGSLAFWATPLGLAGFVIGRAADAGALAAAGAVVMGAGLLIGSVGAAGRLRSVRPASARVNG